VNQVTPLTTSLGVLAAATVLLTGCGGDSTGSTVAGTQPAVPSITSPLGSQANPTASSQRSASTATAPPAASTKATSGDTGEQKSAAERARASLFGPPPAGRSAKLAFCRRRVAVQIEAIESHPASDNGPSEIQKKGGVEAVRKELLGACMRQPPAGGTGDK
jgi:hypothetical protein